MDFRYFFKYEDLAEVKSKQKRPPSCPGGRSISINLAESILDDVVQHCERLHVVM